MKSFKNGLLSRIGQEKSEKGFSLIDVVVTVAIIVALSIGGFVAYTGLVDNAKQGAVDYAASNVYKSALTYESDGRDETSACSAIDEYNESAEGIRVELIVPDEGTYFGEDRPAENDYNCA